MATTLEDIVIQYHAPEYVERRIDDWKQRLNNLFSLIQQWLPEGWEAKEGEPVVMHEKILKSAGVEQTTIPTLKVFNREGEEFVIEPRGLWVISANGQVDLKYSGERYIIYDTADNFDQPEWKVASRISWRHREDLTHQWIHQLLS